LRNKQNNKGNGNEDEFFKLKTPGKSLYEESDLNETETSRYIVPKDEMIDFENNEIARELLQQRFVERHFGVDKLTQREDNEMDEEIYGDFEDLEASNTEYTFNIKFIDTFSFES
jgi:hypothetical protein